MIPVLNTHPEVAKDQHCIPQTYMRQWSYNIGSSVWVFDKSSYSDYNWKTRNVETINFIRKIYDIKAGDLYTNQEALDEIFGFLSNYDISIDGISLSSLEELNASFRKFNKWHIIKPDGQKCTKREQNLIKDNLNKARFTYIETAWSKIENDYFEHIVNIENQARIIKGLISGEAQLTKMDIEQLIEFMIIFNWRSEEGHINVKMIIDWFISLFDDADIHIPFEDRNRREDITIKDEIRHSFLRKDFYDYFHNSGVMKTYIEQYTKKLSLLFYLTDIENPFITSDCPSFMLKRDDGFQEHIFVATPTMIVSTARTDNTDQFLIFKLSGSEVTWYNEKIASTGSLLISNNELINIKELIH